MSRYPSRLSESEVIGRYEQDLSSAEGSIRNLKEEVASLKNQLDIANKVRCSLSEYDNLEATIKNQMEIIREYYEHNKNNKQICGLNYRANQALKGGE